MENIPKIISFLSVVNQRYSDNNINVREHKKSQSLLEKTQTKCLRAQTFFMSACTVQHTHPCTMLFLLVAKCSSNMQCAFHGQICAHNGDNCTCCHTETDDANQTCNIMKQDQPVVVVTVCLQLDTKQHEALCSVALFCIYSNSCTHTSDFFRRANAQAIHICHTYGNFLMSSHLHATSTSE